MQDIPMHPVLVHIPIGLAVVMPLIAFGLTLALSRGLLERRAWVVAVALQAILLAGALTAMKTGEGEEERVEKIVGERRIEAHEERAEAFTWAAGVTLVLSGAVLMVGPSGVVAAAGAATLASLVTFGLAYRTGHSGGEIVYKHGAASAYAEPASGRATAAGTEERGHENGD